MTPPVLVTAPTDPVVALEDLKLHLRVDHDDEDDLIEALQAAAVAHLDGWKGVLGRAIKAQTWRQEFTSSETARLALPDVSAITATGYDAEGETVAVTTTLKSDYRGHYVEVTGPYDTVRIDYTCAMAAQQLPAAQAAVKLLVGHWYENRESVVIGQSVSNLPLAVEALVTAMRWADM
ncbi:head-tail connector protein [Gemmobacter denitrificans]|uniref:Head-tail connector protein n=1 Tax=Gemmobacter denitrificans TaxID=3123040 RepID=A0ABU8BQY9_9RHOB